MIALFCFGDFFRFFCIDGVFWCVFFFREDSKWWGIFFDFFWFFKNFFVLTGFCGVFSSSMKTLNGGDFFWFFCVDGVFWRVFFFREDSKWWGIFFDFFWFFKNFFVLTGFFGVFSSSMKTLNGGDFFWFFCVDGVFWRVFSSVKTLSRGDFFRFFKIKKIFLKMFLCWRSFLVCFLLPWRL